VTDGPDTPGGTSPGQLFIVSTPIGNLADFTFRAVEALASAALVVAEDTRHSRTLLDHYRITTPVAAYHEHNEARETPRLVARLLEGESIALISDAGTPLVSDPGARLVHAAVAAGITVVPIPGASALLAALVASALPSERFSFYGFLARKGKERSAAIADIVRSPLTVIVYESPNRVAATLAELASAGAAERQVVVARELTKKFETFLRGRVGELAQTLAGSEVRGEIVLVIDGATEIAVDETTLREQAQLWREQGASSRDIVERLMQEYGAARNVAYRLAHDR